MRMYKRSAIFEALTNGLSNQANGANRIDKLIFATETVSNPSSSFVTLAYDNAGLSSSS